MITLRNCVGGLTTLLAGLVWFGGAASGRAADNPGAQIINIDFNGAQNNEGPRGPGPTYVGLGAAGGGSVWNGILVDSRLPDGLDDHNLTVSGENLTDSLGAPTAVSFTISPVGGDDPGAGTDPAAPTALLGDYLYVGSGGQITGEADFAVSGLGAVPFVDLYFYYGAAGNFVVPGASATPFVATGIFTPGNTIHFAKVAVTDGTVTGTVGTGPTTILHGMTIQQAKPQPFVKSAGPTGPTVRFNTAIAVELQDYVTHVVPSSVRLEVNGQAVMATVSKPVASAITTVTYAPAGGWVQGSTNAFRIVFADDAVPPVVQTNDWGFVVLNEALAAAIVNIDFTGTQNEYGPRGPGPLYVGQGPAGGGTAWSEIALDTRLPDGTDDRTLSASGNDLVNSLGETTTVGFTMGPVGADDWYAGTDPAAADALWGDYLFFMDSVSWTQQADFTISGLGDAPWVDLYFLSGSHAASARSFIVTEGSRAPYTANGIFTPANTLYFAKVPVTDGTVTGSTGNPALTVLNGLTIRQPLPQPFIKSASPTGNTVRRNTAIKVELQDYVTRVVPSSVQLEVNGQAVVATVSKPAGSTVTTITYTPAGGWASASTNTFRIIFGDDAVPPVTQTGDFAFVALNESLAAATINIDFTGTQNDPGPRGPGPLYVGQGPAGGGTAWSEIVLDTRLWDGTDDRTLSASGTNLVDSLGDATTVGFIMGPVGADDWFGGADPAAADALWGDYLFFVDSVMGVERADFTISGLGIVPSVDLYFLSGSHGPGARSFVVNGASPAAFVANGIFTPDNTLYFANVPVTDGTVTGSTGNPALSVLNGLTIRKPVSQPQTLTIVRQGNSVVVSWTGTGTLQIADRVTGGWNDLPNATSPQTVTPAQGQKFYRLRQ